jgi:hypothetical protein
MPTTSAATPQQSASANTASQQSPTGANVPFQLATRASTRFSYSVGTVTLSATANTPIPPIMIPAVGFLRGLNLEVTGTLTTGTSSPTPDTPFTALQVINLKTAAGNDIITPVTGYQAYLMQKYGSKRSVAPYSDARLGQQYASSATGFHYFQYIPLELDARTGFGALPAMASNRSYQLILTAAALSAINGGSTAGTLQINITAEYWSEPAATTVNGTPQTVMPVGSPTSISQWNIAQYPLTPGDKYITLSSSVGNVINEMIFTLRNSAGARIGYSGATGWPALCEIYLDNEPIQYLTNNEWSDNMTKRWQMPNALDTGQGLDTGVYVYAPEYDNGGTPGDPSTCNSQVLITVDSSQLQIRGTTWGSNASTLEVLTHSTITQDPTALYKIS